MYPPEVFLAVALLEAQRLPTIAIYHNARHIKRKTFLGGGLFSVQLACQVKRQGTFSRRKDTPRMHRPKGTPDRGDSVEICLFNTPVGQISLNFIVLTKSKRYSIKSSKTNLF